jgi:hypothetical protein
MLLPTTGDQDERVAQVTALILSSPVLLRNIAKIQDRQVSGWQKDNNMNLPSD